MWYNFGTIVVSHDLQFAYNYDWVSQISCVIGHQLPNFDLLHQITQGIMEKNLPSYLGLVGYHGHHRVLLDILFSRRFHHLFSSLIF